MIRKIFNASVASIVYIVMNMLVNIVQSGMAVRYLNEYDLGVWLLFLGINVFINYCDFGFGPALSREIGLSSGRDDAEVWVANFFVTVKRLNSIIFISVFFVSVFVAVIAFCWHKIPLRILYAFVIFAFGAGVRLKANPLLALIYGLRHVSIERTIRWVVPLFGLLIYFVLLELQVGIIGLSIGFFCQSIILYFFCYITILKKKLIQEKGRYLRSIFRGLLQPCWQWSLMGLGSIFIFQLPSFLLAKILGPSAVPKYNLPLQIFLTILSISLLFQTAVTPFFSELYGEKSYDKLKQLFFLNVKINVAITGTLAIFFLFFAKQIIFIWLGRTEVLNESIFILLFITVLLEAHHVSAAYTTMACGYVKFAVPSLLGGFLTVMFAVFFIKKLGAVGAALAVMCAQMLTNNWYVVIKSLDFLQIGKKEYAARVCLPVVLYLLSFFVVFFLLHHFCFGSISNQYSMLSVGLLGMMLSSIVLSYWLLTTKKQKKYIGVFIFGIIDKIIFQLKSVWC